MLRRASACALIVRVLSAGLAYFVQVVLARLTGQHEYGVFAYVWVWFMILSSVVSIGFGDSVIRHIPGYTERRDFDRLRGFLRFGVLVTTGGSILASVSIALLALSFSDRFENVYLQPVLLMTCALPLACMQYWLEGIGRGYKWTLIALVPLYVMRHALILAFMVGAVWFGFPATAATAFACVVVAVGVSLLVQAVATLIPLRRTLAEGPRIYERTAWLREAIPFSLMHSAYHLFSFTDVLVLALFFAPGEIAVYFAATRVIQVVNMISFASSVGAAPLLSSLHASGQTARLADVTRAVSFWTFLAGLSGTIAFVLLGPWLLGLFGEGFVDGYSVFLVLALGIVAKMAGGAAEDLLNMTGHSHVAARTFAVAVMINLALNLALVPLFGLVGAAVATSASLALRAALLALEARRNVGIEPSIFSARPNLAAIRTLLAKPAPDAAE